MQTQMVQMAQAMSPKAGWQQQASFFPAASDAASSAASSQEYTGTLKSFSARNDYGFVECDETKALFQRDVYVHGNLLPKKEVGTKVKFTVGMNQKGHPQVQKCSLA